MRRRILEVHDEMFGSVLVGELDTALKIWSANNDALRDCLAEDLDTRERVRLSINLALDLGQVFV
jgi:hypothetical protein